MTPNKLIVPRRLGVGIAALLAACTGTNQSNSIASASQNPLAVGVYVSLSGTDGANGAVTSTSAPTDTAQISCGKLTAPAGKKCGAAFLPGTVVTLAAVDATPSSVVTWFGDCASAGHALTCVLPALVDKAHPMSVNVQFDLAGKAPGMANGIFSSIAASPASVIADGVSTSLVTVIARDAGNAPLAGKTVAFTNTGTCVLSAATAVTGADGVATVTILSSTVQSCTVSAMVDGQTVIGSATPAVPATVSFTATSAVSGIVVAIDGVTGLDRVVAGATVKSIVDGKVTAAGVLTDATGAFSLKVPPGTPVFVRVEPPTSGFGSTALASETRNASFGGPLGAPIELAMPPTLGATYTGTESCQTCHAGHDAKLASAAHTRSVTKIARDGSGAAVAGAFTRMVNLNLVAAGRHVMNPIGTGTISIGDATGSSATVVGTGTHFATTDGILVGDKLVYTPNGLGQYTLGTVLTVDSDTQLTLGAKAVFAPQVVSISGQRYGVDRQSKVFSKEMPMDSTDIVAPNWPGVKATSPNSDPNSAGGGTQVQVYFCNLKGSTVQGVNYANDEYVQKFGGLAWTCADGAFYDGTVTPAVPLVHIEYIYGGQGDNDGTGVQGNKPNVGVFKQRYQGRMSDVKYAFDNWKPGVANGYATQGDFDRDTLTLPIQLLHSGDLQTGDQWLNKGYKLNGYHPTEQKFPGESWSQRTRTFSHACAGCHNTGLVLDFNVVTQPLAFPRDDGATSITLAAVTKYSWANGSSPADFNVGCEHCHGPGSQHVTNSTPTLNAGAIVNPKYLTADKERQACGKCHGYDDAADGRVNVGGTFVEQTYGFEAPWNSENMAGLGNGNFVPGVHDLFDPTPGKDFIGNWAERLHDGEAGWNPDYTPENRYANVEGAGAEGKNVFLGQAHRQQYAMMQYSKHTNNPYEQLTCSTCHDSHSTYLGSPEVKNPVDYSKWQFNTADFRNNVACLSCHAGFGDFATVTKQDVANVHLAPPVPGIPAGTVTRNGLPVVATAATSHVADAVTGHMKLRAGMVLSTTVYNPTADTTVPGNVSGATYVKNAAKALVTNGPIGRCTSCHMPKVAKSGGYFNDVDVNGLLALVESDQASHTFDVIMPSATPPLGSGGPTFQSGSYNYKGYVLPGGKTASDPLYNALDAPLAKRYDYYGYMPNSCGKCHLGARKASLVVPDVSGLFPGKGALGQSTRNEEGCGEPGHPACVNLGSWWPLSEHLYDVSGTADDPVELKTCFSAAGIVTTGCGGTGQQACNPLGAVFCNQIKATGALVPSQPLP